MSETEQERRDALAVLAKEVPDYVKEFGDKSVGEEQLRDRIKLLQSMWEDHVASHPSVVMNRKLYKFAHKITSKMSILYFKV